MRGTNEGGFGLKKVYPDCLTAGGSESPNCLKTDEGAIVPFQRQWDIAIGPSGVVLARQDWTRPLGMGYALPGFQFTLGLSRVARACDGLLVEHSGKHPRGL